MKVNSFRGPRCLVGSVAQGRTVLRGSWSLFRRRKLPSLVLLVAAVTLGVLIWPHDRALLARLHVWRGAQEAVAHNIAWYLSICGDYLTYNVPLALAIWLYGVVTKKSGWRRLAVICFLGASLAGLFDDFLRLTFGRPRPDSHIRDGLYGLAHAFNGAFLSFPSGHAASVFGAAAALFVTDLWLGVVTALFACAVVWARMEIYRHYPSDVAVGAIIGVYFGLMIGFGAKVRRSRLADRSKFSVQRNS